MPTARFDPKSDVPYGTCSTCSTVMPDEEAAREHMSETFAQNGARGHAILIENASREDRIEAHVGHIVEDAIDEAVREIVRDLERVHTPGDDVGSHITAAELSAALRRIDLGDRIAEAIAAS